jgi:hypothetical protein
MQTRQPNLESAGTPLRRLVKEALRMRPSGIVEAVARSSSSRSDSRAGRAAAVTTPPGKSDMRL